MLNRLINIALCFTCGFYIAIIVKLIKDLIKK